MIDGVGGGKKSGEKFFLTWQKNRENVVEKCGEVIEKSWTKMCWSKISLFFKTTNQSIR